MAHPDQVYCCIEDFYGIENPKDAEPGQAFFAEVVRAIREWFKTIVECTIVNALLMTGLSFGLQFMHMQRCLQRMEANV